MVYPFCVIKSRCAKIGVESFKEIKTVLTGVTTPGIFYYFIHRNLLYVQVPCLYTVT